MQGANVFSTIDLKNRLFHVLIDEECCKYTSFVTPTGQYEFLKTPFGMCNSPVNFQRFIDKVFKEHIRTGIVLVYMDIITLSKTEEEAVADLKKVLKTVEEYGLQI